MNAPAFLWIIALPLALAPVLYLVAYRTPRYAHAAALALLLGLTFPLALSAQSVLADGPQLWTWQTLTLRWDGFSILLSGLGLVLGVSAVLYAAVLPTSDGDHATYAPLILLANGALAGSAAATDLFNAWLWLELLSLTCYGLIAVYRTAGGALTAAAAYLVQGALGSACLLFACALALGATGTLTFDGLRAAPPGLALLAAAALCVVGLGTKAALAPFHAWLPDAHAQAPAGVSALLSGVVLAAALGVLARAGSALIGATPLWGPLLLGAGTLNISLGNLLAFRQTNLKRLLACSSIAHTGYALFGLGISATLGTPTGAEGSALHLLAHGLLKGLAFLAIGALLYALDAHRALTIADLAGTAERNPLLAFTLSLALFGLGGLPPVIGFASKWRILAAGMISSEPWLIALVALAALNGVLATAYYAPLVAMLYTPHPGQVPGQPLSFALQAPLAALALAAFVLGLWPGSVDGLIVLAGQALAGP